MTPLSLNVAQSSFCLHSVILTFHCMNSLYIPTHHRYHCRGSFTHTVNVTVYVSGTFDLFDVTYKQCHGNTLIPFLSGAKNGNIDGMIRSLRVGTPRETGNFSVQFSRQEKRLEFNKDLNVFHRVFPCNTRKISNFYKINYMNTMCGFCSNFWVGDIPVMEWGYLTKLHYICDCSLEGIRNSICLCWLWNLFYTKKNRTKTKSTGKSQRISSLSECGNPGVCWSTWKVRLHDHPLWMVM